MRRWSNRDEVIAAVPHTLPQSRPLLRRAVAEQHRDPESPVDPANTAAEGIVEHLERSRYEVRPRAEKLRRQATP